MLADHHSKQLNSVRLILGTATKPLYHFFLIPRNTLSLMNNHSRSKASLKKYVQDLKIKNLELNALAIREKYLFKETNQLRKLLKLRQHLPILTTSVTVISDFQSEHLRKIMIDHGRQHGMIIGAPVITKNGLLGQITNIHASKSEVTLITHNAATIPIENLRTGTRAILKGRAPFSDTEILYQPVSSKMEVGDKLVTSGLDQYYPAGLPVAEITYVEKNSRNAITKILAKPTVPINKVDFALVIQPITPRLTKISKKQIKNKHNAYTRKATDYSNIAK